MNKSDLALLSQIMVAFNRDKVTQVWPIEMISEKTGISPVWFLTALQPFCHYAKMAGYSLEDCLICVAVMGAAEIGARKSGWAMRDMLIEVWASDGNAHKYRAHDLDLDSSLIGLVETLRANHTGPDWLGEYFPVKSCQAPLTVLFNSPEFDMWKGVFNAG